MQRPFTSGSRQAPDPFDQFLEDNFFYRKHTARDSSCLFRVISEQMYDTQLYHLTVRKNCVSYMRTHRSIFEAQFDKDLDEYLDDMSKPKTYGTLIELQAVSYLFKRNVQLFEPFNLGNYFTQQFNSTDIFRVFYTPERHFDSVFTSEYIKEAAICQSICYEILYKELFKLPDVIFAVEQMLHSPSFDTIDDCQYERNEEGYCTRLKLQDGRSFEFDLPEKTLCILENYKLCHFHYSNFPRFSEDLRRELKTTKRDNGEPAGYKCLSKTVESLLPEKYISCVRQLLLEGITPFPYKVAKALDPNMYRNIEFDSWNEARKELKLQNWYIGDSNFRVGAKCHVKLCKSDPDLYTCHIQEISIDKGYCVVYVEQLGEKRLVPYESLKPLPPDQFKPWSLPYRLQRHMQRYSSFRYTRHQYNYHFKVNDQLYSAHNDCLAAELKDVDYYDYDDDPKMQHHYHKSQQQRHRNDCYHKLKRYTQLQNFRATQPLEYCTMPLTVEHHGRNENAHGNKSLQQRGGGSSSSAALADSSRVSSRCSDGQKQQLQPQDSTVVTTDDAATSFGPLDTYEPGDSGSFVPELHCLYPMHQYPEDYYGYGYDGSIIQAGLPTTAIMPPNGVGPFYYMCNATSVYPQNIYMQAPPPAPALSHGITTGTTASQLFPAMPNHQQAYYPTSHYYAAAAAIPVTSSSSSAPVATTPDMSGFNMTPTMRRGKAITTQVSGRVNFDAKKSLKSNGADLPQDIPTLRYFFNLGLEYHKHMKRIGNEAFDNKENIVKITTEMQNIKFEENHNEVKQPDTNNNSISTTISNNSNSNTNYSGNNKSQRRFPSRYFNNKDRQNYQRGGGAGQQQQHNRSHQNDYKGNGGANSGGHKSNAGNNAGSGNNSTPNSSHPSGCGVGEAGGGDTNLALTEQGIQTSPMGFYEHCESIGEMVQTTPTTYNQNQNIITYGSYVQECNSDQFGGVGVPLVPPPHPSAGGMYIQMPVPSSPYGIYSGPPPAPQPMAGLHPAPAAGYSYMGPPPTGVPMLSPVNVPPPPTPSSQSLHPNPLPVAATFYTTPNPDVGSGLTDSNIGGGGGIIDPASSAHYQCMSYPPPLQLYYSPRTPSTGAAAAAGTAASNVVQPQSVGTAIPQGYWCLPPTAQPLPSPQSTVLTNSTAGGGIATSTCSSLATNRRDKQCTD